MRNAGLLLAAAKELFGERGPDVALDEVARRAGVGNATLYRHFPTREDLLAAAYADEADALCRRGDALLGDALLDAPSPGAALRLLRQGLEPGSAPVADVESSP